MKRVALAFTTIALASSMSASAMTSEQQTAFFRHIRNQLDRCFVLLPMTQAGMVQFEIHLARDGSLSRPPRLKGPLTDQKMAQAVLRAVSRCAPFDIPSAFTNSYDEWKHVNVYFEF